MIKLLLLVAEYERACFDRFFSLDEFCSHANDLGWLCAQEKLSRIIYRQLQQYQGKVLWWNQLTSLESYCALQWNRVLWYSHHVSNTWVRLWSSKWSDRRFFFWRFRQPSFVLIRSHFLQNSLQAKEGHPLFQQIIRHILRKHFLLWETKKFRK